MPQFKRSILVLTLALMTATNAHAGDGTRPVIEIGVGEQVSQDAHHENPLLQGSVWISQKGQITVIWDSLELNLGKFQLSSDGDGERFSAVFPSVTLDLKKLLGARWTDTAQLTVAAGSYDDDAVRATRDLQIGRIELALSQSVVSNDAWSWSVTESAGGAAYFRRVSEETGNEFEAVPVTLKLDNQIVRHFSQEVAATLAIGAYTTVLNSLQDHSHFLSSGAYAAIDTSLGKRLSAGARIEASELLKFGSDARGKVAVNVTAYVQYVLHRALSPGQFEHAISLRLGSSYDEANAYQNGQARRSKYLRVQYGIKF